MGRARGHVWQGRHQEANHFGYKLHLLVTLNGVILDFHLAPAHVSDVTVGADVLHEHTNLTVLGDKGYISQALATDLAATKHIRLLTIPRRNHQQQLPQVVAQLLNAQRQIIETVHDQLTEQFQLDTNHAYNFTGLCARSYTKLTAYTLSIYLNPLFGNVDFLRIKWLAFPI